MTNPASATRNPYPELSAPITDLSLDVQIARAEEAVIVRDSRIRRRTDALVQRVKSDALRHAGGGLAVGVGAVALAWWLNRRKPAAAATAAPPAARPAEGEHLLRDAGLSLAGLLPLIWPLMPRSLRRSVSPRTAGTLLTFATPLVAGLFKRKPRQPAAR